MSEHYEPEPTAYRRGRPGDTDLLESAYMPKLPPDPAERRSGDRTAGILLRYLDEDKRVLVQIADGIGVDGTRLSRRKMRKLAREQLATWDPS